MVESVERCWSHFLAYKHTLYYTLQLIHSILVFGFLDLLGLAIRSIAPETTKRCRARKKFFFPVLIVVTVTIALIGSAQIADRSAKTIDKNVTGRVSRCSYVNFNVIPRVNS